MEIRENKINYDIIKRTITQFTEDNSKRKDESVVMEVNRKRILLVDDNRAIHEDFKQILQTEGSLLDVDRKALERELFDDVVEDAYELPNIQYIIDDAFQGEEAIEMVDLAAQQNDPYALVFMDVRMPPGIDGIETIQRIWQKHPNIEMIICTAYSDYSWNDILEKFGSTDHLLFIQKPFNSVAIRQIALTMTTKWELDRKNREHIENLEGNIAERTKDLNLLVEEKERYIHQIREEVTLAELVQRQLLPAKLPSVPGIDIVASYIPATVIGGDLYDVVQVSSSTIAFLIFDVSGHGIAAALVTAVGKFSFQQHMRDGHTPDKVLELVNKDIFASTPPQMYLTAFLLMYNTETGEACFSGAGHVPQLHYVKETNSISELKGVGFFLGINEGSTYKNVPINFKKGDKIIFYTDGIPESLDPDDELFGREPIHNVVLENAEKSSSELLDSLIQKNTEFLRGRPRNDDVCILVVSIT